MYCKLSLDTLNEMTWSDFQDKLVQENYDIQKEWLVGRELIALTANVNRGKKGRALSGQDIINLSFFDEIVQPLTKDEIEEKRKQFLKYWGIKTN